MHTFQPSCSSGGNGKAGPASGHCSQLWPELTLSIPYITQVHTRKLKLDPDVTDDVLRQVARDLPGLSGQAIALLALLLHCAPATSDMPALACSC